MIKYTGRLRSSCSIFMTRHVTHSISQSSVNVVKRQKEAVKAESSQSNQSVHDGDHTSEGLYLTSNTLQAVCSLAIIIYP